MANYIFEQLTDGTTIQGGTLTFTAAGAWATTVVYLTPSIIEVTSNGHTVNFLAGQLSGMSVGGDLIFTDGSQLLIGDDNNNQLYFFRAFPGSAIFGGGGDDTLASWGYHSLVQGNAGNDWVTTNGDTSTVYGGQGNDTVLLAGGSSFAQGNKGDDTIEGSGQGADTILGGQGDDSITGSGWLDGNLGDDKITGSGQLLGEGGADTLTWSGFGAATMTGGDGPDLFVLGRGPTGQDAIPHILDWNGAEDRISFPGNIIGFGDFAAVTAPDYATAVSMAQQQMAFHSVSFVAAQVGSDVILFAGGGGGPNSAVDLVGRTLADINAHNII